MEVTNTPDAQSRLIPVSQVMEGFNYRRRYNPEKMASLRESIKAQGLIQPVVLRQLADDSFQLIAGGRRFKAVVAEFGPEAKIKAEVKVMTDAEATAAMLAENNEREDPSIIEDAEGASRMLGLCKGDREEAARRLGWSRAKLDRRLAVMNATQEVRDAYLNDKIMVGHVEILAALRKEVQERVIAALLKADRKVTVEELKAMAEVSLQSLNAAIFDRTECGSCQYNTGMQQAMFETSFSGSRCTNKECYQGKTEAELQARAKAMTETYQVVRIVRPGENATLEPLRADGSKGVGEAQAKACRTCGDFGACVSAVPDKLGLVYKDVCFNKTCNDEKVAANAKALKAEQDAANAAQEPTANPQSKEASLATIASAAKPKAGNSTTQPKKVVASAEPRGAVKEYRETIWRAVFKRAAEKLPVLQNRALLVTLALHRPSDMDRIASSGAIEKALGIKLKTETNTHALLTSILGLEQNALATALQHLAANVSSNAPISDVTGYLKALDIKIEQYWKLNETFLDILTKTEIDAVCSEIGLADAAGKHYDRLKNGPKKDFVKAMLAVEGFQYVGAVPALMSWGN
ncbi:PRTRC system ParB family protein [Hydrogenophaga sp. BPS33]|uniref:PRTRC system ParB family protein n=1 Tax=Hydrogenophaga sp. BPS33 TaxID=2651974 RepID=UPI00131F7A8E|nr:PRTRC system ParB family protein [Hydrogenophaga sp. BPS33]QHE89378.1 PRTRC system ParB family protein [Hydrogenophaga sp. BPS33]